MQIPEDLSPTLAYDVTQAAHLYGISVDDWVAQKLRIVCDELADALPHYKAIIDHKP